MAMTEYTGDTAIIAGLGTTPDERGLTTDQFKAKFDEGPAAFVAWFNATHLVEVNAHLAETVSQVVGATRDISITGDQIISFTLPFAPKSIKVAGMVYGTKGHCEGKATGVSVQKTLHALADTGSWYTDPTSLIRLANGNPSYDVTGKITAVSATSITINWAIASGSVTAGTTAHLLFEFSTH